ncbi:unnamed protein product [Vitrella brassicaformis CCMP3155]|uniref:Uncharacterized protein n=2 Tax=Vitrella brassicaformis TaxID=1169539 RepID=A0A0G4EHI3_VITBC|nr:unnamed protein product [Vitrella brassicaformis CCMP3155]|eukprot:CEL95480.1 unnamed protein product [Vitrella brassicaformis CCMP3155]
MEDDISRLLPVFALLGGYESPPRWHESWMERLGMRFQSWLGLNFVSQACPDVFRSRDYYHNLSRGSVQAFKMTMQKSYEGDLSDLEDVVESRLLKLITKWLERVNQKGLKVQCQLEDVHVQGFGRLAIVLGAHRGQALGKRVVYRMMGHYLVVPPSIVPSNKDSTEPKKSFNEVVREVEGLMRQGGVVRQEVLLSARQSLALVRPQPPTAAKPGAAAGAGTGGESAKPTEEARVAEATTEAAETRDAAGVDGVGAASESDQTKKTRTSEVSYVDQSSSAAADGSAGKEERTGGGEAVEAVEVVYGSTKKMRAFHTIMLEMPLHPVTLPMAQFAETQGEGYPDVEYEANHWTICDINDALLGNPPLPLPPTTGYINVEVTGDWDPPEAAPQEAKTTDAASQEPKTEASPAPSQNPPSPSGSDESETDKDKTRADGEAPAEGREGAPEASDKGDDRRNDEEVKKKRV